MKVVCVGYTVKLSVRTDGGRILFHNPERVREMIAGGLEHIQGLQEEIDFTLEVERIWEQR